MFGIFLLAANSFFLSPFSICSILFFVFCWILPERVPPGKQRAAVERTMPKDNVMSLVNAPVLRIYRFHKMFSLCTICNVKNLNNCLFVCSRPRRRFVGRRMLTIILWWAHPRRSPTNTRWTFSNRQSRRCRLSSSPPRARSQTIRARAIPSSARWMSSTKSTPVRKWLRSGSTTTRLACSSRTNSLSPRSTTGSDWTTVGGMWMFVKKCFGGCWHDEMCVRLESDLISIFCYTMMVSHFLRLFRSGPVQAWSKPQDASTKVSSSETKS